MRIWPIVLALLAVAGGLTLLERKTPPAERPRLVLLTSLPLLFGEEFALETAKPAAMTRIERQYVIVPIPIADAASLKGQRLLLMAHPRAQPAEVLVDLDAWVRRGGRVVLLADPALKWESSRPLGDRTRPPPDFADTGLLDHWGLRMGIDPAREGSLRALDQRCTVAERGLIARCRVGRGSAIVIADADFIMMEGEDADRRLDLMMGELSRAQKR
jgi:hypothetical protein